MNKVLCALGLAILLTGPAQAADKHPFGIHDMLAMDRVADPRVSPDGSKVVFSLSTIDLAANKRRSSLWIAGTDGAPARRLTTAGSDSQARWSPDGKSLYFVSGRSGSAQVWKLSFVGGEAEQITDLPLDVDALEVAPTGTFLVLSMAVFPDTTPAQTKTRLEAKEKAKTTGMIYESLFFRHWDTWANGTRNHLFVYDLAKKQAKDLMPAMDADCPTAPFGGSEDFALSPDAGTLVFSAKNVGREEAWSTNFDLYSVKTDGSAAPAKLTSNPAWDAAPRFSPDGRTLAYAAMSRPGYEADRFDLVLRDWATGQERKIIVKGDDSSRGDRSAGELTWLNDGKEILCTSDHLGQKALFAVDVATGRTRIVVGEGSVGNPQPLANGRILYTLHSLQGPVELYTAGRDGKGIARVTRFNDPKLAQAALGAAEQFSFTGAKGDKVHGYLVRPAGFDPAKKYPVAFLIHGGPQGSFGNDFHYRWNPQAYAGAGYAAVMIDFHGSTGYGQAFTDAINGDWGGAPYEDLMKGLDHALKTYPFLDKDRVGALGASYGGYMINWIAGQTDRFKCLVSHDGNLDEKMAYFDTEELWFPEWEHGGTPWSNPKGYAKHNPVDFVQNWKTPMLIVHGGKDYRVVDTQGMSSFTVLQRKGIPSKFLYFPDENHWVLRPANSILWHETVLGWLDRWLKK
jgi:dipeptidyl aminopeptidase/acylaminoacyl peptidase